MVTCSVCLAKVNTPDIEFHLAWHEKIARATVMTAVNMEVMSDLMKMFISISQQINEFAIANSPS